MLPHCQYCGGRLEYSELFKGWECVRCGKIDGEPESLSYKEAEIIAGELVKTAELPPEEINKIVDYVLSKGSG